MFREKVELIKLIKDASKEPTKIKKKTLKKLAKVYIGPMKEGDYRRATTELHNFYVWVQTYCEIGILHRKLKPLEEAMKKVRVKKEAE